MDKVPGEEDFKGLEEEIEDAVDRLFVENKRGVGRSLSMESPLSGPSLKSQIEEPSVKSLTPEPSLNTTPLELSMESPLSEPSIEPAILEPSMKPSFLEPSYEFESEKNLDLGSSPRPPSPPIQFSKSIENMEAQLLSLEWDITEDKLEKTKEEVLALRELLKQKADITSILSDMEEVLDHMIKNEEDIRPSWIKFLLDSKETIKLLTRKETGGEINIYKQLAYLGIEARFSSLEGIKDMKITQPSINKAEGIEKTEASIPGEKKVEDMSNKMNLFMTKVEEIFKTMKQQISRLEETARKPPAPSIEVKSKPVNVTIFRVEERLFGVESEKVFKLFRVPSTFQEKYLNRQKIRVRDFEVKMINLKKILAIEGEEPKGEIKILAVKDNGEYKGFLVDQVLRKISSVSEREGEVGEYFSGIIHSTIQEQSVEIPILDLKKL
jgi:chemotaxis protein histidine kinase CheA